MLTYEKITTTAPTRLAGFRDTLCDGDTMLIPAGRLARAAVTVGDMLLMNALAEFPPMADNDVEPTEVDDPPVWVVCPCGDYDAWDANEHTWCECGLRLDPWK